MWSLENKIEEIRAKPEHIRIRYVYASVVVSMLFVVMIWFVSLKVNISLVGQPPQNPAVEDLRTQFNEAFSDVQEEAQTIDDLVEDGTAIYERALEETGEATATDDPGGIDTLGEIDFQEMEPRQ